MDARVHSLTALAASLFREVHTRRDEPRLIEDGYGSMFVTDVERAAIFERLLLMLNPARREQLARETDRSRAFDDAVRENPAYGTIVVRSRYAEERLDALLLRGLRQYVVVGAGMDTFAFRQRGPQTALQIFEIDHPATQAMKRERLTRAGLAPPANVHLIPVDLEHESIRTALSSHPSWREVLALFSFLGVTTYLTRDANLRIFGEMARVAPASSEVVFDYLEADVFAPERASEEARRMAAERATTEEPWMSGFDPASLRRDLASVGLELAEDLDGERVRARYLAQRADGLRAVPHGHLARARVVGSP